MTAELFVHTFEVMSLAVLGATLIKLAAQKQTLPSTIYPSVRDEATATNRPYFVANITNDLVNWTRSNNERGLK